MIIMIIFIIIMIFIMMIAVIENKTMATTVLIAERLALEDAVRELLVTASATGVHVTFTISAMFIIVNITILTDMAFTRPPCHQEHHIRLLIRIRCIRPSSLSSMPAKKKE